MTRTYAIPDIHGRLDLLEMAIDAITSHASGHGGNIVTLGDYIDRGPSSRQVVERLMNWKLEDFEIVNLKGNHEAIMLAVCNAQAELEWWVRNGGSSTLASYNKASDRPDFRGLPRTHLEWMGNLRVLYVDQHRVYVHAAVDASTPLNAQNEEILLWRRYPKGVDRGHGRRYVVHGHDADPDGPFIGKARANLDVQAWQTGRLTVGVFDDDSPGGPQEVLEVKI